MGLSDRFAALRHGLGLAARAFSRPAPIVSGSPTGTPRGATKGSPRLERLASSAEALFGRISYGAGPSHTRYSSYPGTGLDPTQILAIHRQNYLGYPQLKQELDEQILERDAHLGGINQARIVEVSGKPFRIHPFNETPVAAAVSHFVESCVREIDGFEQDQEDLLSANGRGYSASEIVWQFDRIRCAGPTGDKLLVQCCRPQQLDYVHQKHFRFDQETDEPYLWFNEGQVQLPPGKFIFHSAVGTGLIERRGFMLACAWLHAAKSWALRDWIVYSNLYGLPQVEGLYDGDIEQLDLHRSVYEAMLRDVGQGKPAIHPRDFEVKITNPPSGGRSDDVFGALVGWANTEMSKRVQGETLTTEVGGVGSYAIGEHHADVKNAFVRADARKLAQTLREDLFKPIVYINAEKLAAAFGFSPEEIKAVIPRMSWRIERETTPEVRANIYSIAVNQLGAEIDADQFMDEFGFDRPKPGAAPLSGQPVPVNSGAMVVGSQEASNGADNPDPTKEAAALAVKEENKQPQPAAENKPKAMRKRTRKPQAKE